jgi:hypothetical protein
MPTSYRGILVGLMVADLFLVCFYEYFIVNKGGVWSKNNTGKKDTNAVAKDVEAGSKSS